MSDPQLSGWVRINRATVWSENTDWSQSAQGWAVGGGAWYLSSDGSKSVKKSRNHQWVGEATIFELDGVDPEEIHVGGLDYYDGKLYVALEGVDSASKPNGVLRLNAHNMYGEGYGRISTSVQLGVSWCAVSPLNGRLYTKTQYKLLAFDRLTMARHPEDDIGLGMSAIPLQNNQGGSFTIGGRVLLVQGYPEKPFEAGTQKVPNAMQCYSALTGFSLGAIYLGNYGGGGGSEVESVTAAPLRIQFLPDLPNRPGYIVAHVHILELDNDVESPTDPDDCYLWSYIVPDPRRL